MLKKGDVIVYGTHGLCQVKDIMVPPFLVGSSEKLYYVMEPAIDCKGVLYVPVDGAMDKMRKPVSKKDALQFLEELEEMQEIEVEVGKRAEAEISEVVKINDTYEMMRLMKGLHIARNKRLQDGKKLASMNERHLATVEKLLFTELAFSTKTTVDKVRDRVMDLLSTCLVAI